MMTTVTLVVAVLALLVAGSLIALTTALNEATTESVASVESVRLAEEAEIDLLLYARAADPVLRREIEGNLRWKLAEAERFVTSAQEAQVLAEAKQRVDEYIASGHAAGSTPAEVARRHEAAYGALEALVAIDVEQARASQEDAARWSRFGTILGLSVGALVIVFAVAVLVWLRGRALAPVFGLARAMARFGAGDRDARAVERGPAELREMCVRFNEMADALAARRQAQLAFLGGVAHDLRTPLSTLQLTVGLLGPGQRLPPEERIRQAVARMGRQITRMERMVGDFLDVAKIEAGQLEVRFETHDARPLVRQVVELFEDGLSEHRIEVRLPAHEVLVRCDALRLEQIITNLISNALKYSPARSVVVAALEPRGDEVVLTVTDHGIGLSEEDQARLFEPFRRVGLSKESVPGVGLGLFVVRRLVEAHGGRIEVESAPGQGSTFRVVLPAIVPAAEVEAPRARVSGAAR